MTLPPTGTGADFCLSIGVAVGGGAFTTGTPPTIPLTEGMPLPGTPTPTCGASMSTGPTAPASSIRATDEGIREGAVKIRNGSNGLAAARFELRSAWTILTAARLRKGGSGMRISTAPNGSTRQMVTTTTAATHTHSAATDAAILHRFGCFGTKV